MPNQQHQHCSDMSTTSQAELIHRLCTVSPTSNRNDQMSSKTMSQLSKLYKSTTYCLKEQGYGYVVLHQRPTMTRKPISKSKYYRSTNAIFQDQYISLIFPHFSLIFHQSPAFTMNYHCIFQVSRSWNRVTVTFNEQ